MTWAKPPLDTLVSESDVEQKLVTQLLMAPPPFGLGFSPTTVRTKHNLKRLIIGKGASRKSYFPDYAIVIGGIPLLILEAKEPKEDLAEGFQEARLYATELNAQFPHRINPAAHIVATNGALFHVGKSDQAEPLLALSYDDIDPYSELWAKVQDLIGSKILDAEFKQLSKKLRPKNLTKPRRLVGGPAVQQEELPYNTFGATISTDFAHIFNPVTREDRANVARNAYVSSNRRDRLIEPIDRVVRASLPAQNRDQLVDDTGNPTKLIKPLRKGKQLEHQVMLIIGDVGAGKTTFIDHLQEIGLPDDVRKKTLWVHLNMNVAPVTASEIYDWVRKEIVAGCKAAFPDLDFDELDVIRKVYSVEVNRFARGLGKLSANRPSEYNDQLARTLGEAEADPHQRVNAYARFAAADRGKLLIIVLDNCDKRTRNEQLLMFQVAQWLQREFHALVVLPLREETYDNHREEPPLDTALKDLVFRIEPPLFPSVLVKRVQLALNALKSGDAKRLRFQLPNGFTVQYDASEQAFFLRSIVRSIFVHDYQIRRLIVGLSGRNMRRALEIFLEFCRSGHIGEDEIVRIVRSEGEHVLPLDLVVRVLVRMNRRFYDGDYSFVKNIVSANPADPRLAYFVRLSILRWFEEKWGEIGPSGLKSYFRIADLCAELEPQGVEESVCIREVEYLAKAQCVVTEDFTIEKLTPEHLVRLAPAGFVHLELLSNPNYLAAVSEDTWFSNRKTAEGIAEGIKTIDGQFSEETVFRNAKELVAFLDGVRADGMGMTASMLQESSYTGLTNLAGASAALRKRIAENPWLEAKERYQAGSVVDALIVNQTEHGLFVELEPGMTGLIHASRLPKGFGKKVVLDVGERIFVRVRRVDVGRQRIGLEYVRPGARRGTDPAAIVRSEGPRRLRGSRRA